MARKLVTFKVDEGLLATFDEWCGRNKLTRTSALTSFMQRPVRPPPAPVAPALGCTHAKSMLTVLPYLTRCDPEKGGCGAKVR